MYLLYHILTLVSTCSRQHILAPRVPQRRGTLLLPSENHYHSVVSTIAHFTIEYNGYITDANALNGRIPYHDHNKCADGRATICELFTSPPDINYFTTRYILLNNNFPVSRFFVKSVNFILAIFFDSPCSSSRINTNIS